MTIIRSIKWNKDDDKTLLLTREWLVTNGLGGYASGTLAGVTTRRYHSLLIAALPSPLGRRVMLNHLSELIRCDDGSTIQIGSEERPEDGLNLIGTDYLVEFRLENGLPIWRYQIGKTLIEKTIILLHNQNTVHIIYKMPEGNEKIRLELRPSIHFRPHEEHVNSASSEKYIMKAADNRYELYTESRSTRLRMILYGENSAMTNDGGSRREIFYRSEAERGYESTGVLWSPGYFRAELRKGKHITLVASTEPWETILALSPEEAFQAEVNRREHLLNGAPANTRTGIPAELVFAADQFIITPAGRTEDAIRINAEGGKLKSMIAGYHWFTDWGRDTMISLEGLTLNTGRFREAYWTLRTFAYYVRDGLIPNLFPEGEKQGLYHTADATLWFFHATNRYIQITEDRSILRILLPVFVDIIEHHLKGTIFGICVDNQDGLLRQGAKGYQLTWMDAKVEDWVVTPRRGKAVEINALWYNALKLTSEWLKEENNDLCEKYNKEAEKAYESFNKKFWYEEGNYLYDVIEGEELYDNSFRPNQIFSLSLSYPVLSRDKWERVLNAVKEKLLTPVGLRSLAPGSTEYKAKYFGNLRARDAAYHQGTVWGWLIGPFIDAWLKVYPEDVATTRSFLKGFADHLNEACVGSISEVFDAEEPYHPRGCIAQAWSIAEVLRCWIKTEQLSNAPVIKEKA